jgi:hypothetical protein
MFWLATVASLGSSACEHYGPPYVRADAAAAIACDPSDEQGSEDPRLEPRDGDGGNGSAAPDGGADAARPAGDAARPSSDAAQADGAAPLAVGSDAAVSPTDRLDASTTPKADSGSIRDAAAPEASVSVEASVPSNLGPLNDPLACAACEKQKIASDSACFNVRDACLKATGTAAKGPKASAPKATLCAELLKCVWRTDCAYTADTNSNDDAQCLCGKGKGQDCLLMTDVPIAGACKNEIFAATESTEVGDLLNHFADVSYAVGLAFQVVDCDAIFCAVECGFSKSPDGGL